MDTDFDLVYHDETHPLAPGAECPCVCSACFLGWTGQGAMADCVCPECGAHPAGEA